MRAAFCVLRNRGGMMVKWGYTTTEEGGNDYGRE